MDTKFLLVDNKDYDQTLRMRSLIEFVGRTSESMFSQVMALIVKHLWFVNVLNLLESIHLIFDSIQTQNQYKCEIQPFFSALFWVVNFEMSRYGYFCL